MNRAALTARPRTLSCADAPVLVCLNLQQEHLDPHADIYIPQAREALPRIRRCIDWARATRLTVAHVLTERPDASGRTSLSPPIKGFTPLAREPVVIKRTISLFEERELAKSDELSPFRQAFLVGFSLAHDCAAAALTASSRGAELVLIADATASPALPPFSGACVDHVMQAVLSPIIPIVMTDDLVTRGLLAL